MTTTQIHSNGSKWYGQEPDSIEKLIEVLNTCTLDEMFFGKHMERWVENPKPFVLSPISKENGMYWFFGNFEKVSHVFRIETNDPVIIAQLRGAIMANDGWKKYIHKCKYVN